MGLLKTKITFYYYGLYTWDWGVIERNMSGTIYILNAQVRKTIFALNRNRNNSVLIILIHVIVFVSFIFNDFGDEFVSSL